MNGPGAGHIEHGACGQGMSVGRRLHPYLCVRFSSFTIHTYGINSLRSAASNTPASQTTQVTAAKVVIPPPLTVPQRKEEEWSN